MVSNPNVFLQKRKKGLQKWSQNGPQNGAKMLSFFIQKSSFLSDFGSFLGSLFS